MRFLINTRQLFAERRSQYGEVVRSIFKSAGVIVVLYFLNGRLL
jgi:hypothetical protein